MKRKKNAKLASDNGAAKKGPVTPEGKQESPRIPLNGSRRAAALELVVPPHSACLANEDRRAYDVLLASLIAKFRPEDDAEFAIVREIADFQWKIDAYKQLESAIYNREVVRQGALVQPTLPELRHIEISIAAHEALTGNKTIAEFRRYTQAALRSISQLQNRLRQLQQTWPGADPMPTVPLEQSRLHLVCPACDGDANAEPLNSVAPFEDRFDKKGRLKMGRDELAKLIEKMRIREPNKPAGVPEAA